jgi:hypothetical protein
MSYNPENEKILIAVDIAQVMMDYCSIQPDIDYTKLQAAEFIAQSIDLKRLIGKDNVARCIDPANRTLPIPPEDTELRNLVLIPLAYYTYARALEMFAGTLTDSGYSIEPGASTKGEAGNTANSYRAIAVEFMDDVLDFLKAETPTIQKPDVKKTVPSIRTFGGQENRASN